MVGCTLSFEKWEWGLPSCTPCPLFIPHLFPSHTPLMCLWSVPSGEISPPSAVFNVEDMAHASPMHHLLSASWPLRERSCYWPHSTKEETEAVQRLTALPKATQPIRDLEASPRLPTTHWSLSICFISRIKNPHTQHLRMVTFMEPQRATKNNYWI